MSRKHDPFEQWRDEQLGRQDSPAEPLIDPPDPYAADRIRLSVGREAIREQAIDRMFDAKDAGDTEAFERTSRELVELNRQLFLEQRAELGHIPESVEAAVAALNVAAGVLELLASNQGTKWEEHA